MGISVCTRADFFPLFPALLEEDELLPLHDEHHHLLGVPDVLLSEYGRTWDKKSAVKFKTLLVIVRLNQSDHIGTWRS